MDDAAQPTPGSRPETIEVIAHRGLSGVQPEQTRAAYLEAIALAERTGRRLELECDTHFSADHELILMHDRTLQRTGGRPEAVHDLTVAQLREIDLGSWKVDHPTPDQSALITLVELLDLVAEARGRGVQVGLAIETKHPNPEGLAVDRRVAELLRDRGWDGEDSPVRMISFHLPAVQFAAESLPRLRRTLLVMTDLGEWADGTLPYDTDTMGIDLALLRQHPEIADRLRQRGHHLHVWTPNTAEDLRWCLDLGATGLTTDYADRALAVVDSVGVA